MATCQLRSSSRPWLNSLKPFKHPKLLLTRSNSTSAAPITLNWTEYLAIRRQRRRWETAATIPCSFLGFGGGVAYFGTLDADITVPIMGVEPLIFYGFSTLGCMGLGYLVGPIIGSTLWRISHRRTMHLIEAKDKEFHRRIVKNRVNPTAQSYNNPVPDFYGEKIGSLYQYRQWLRDQAKYKRKAQWAEEGSD